MRTRFNLRARAFFAAAFWLPAVLLTAQAAETNSPYSIQSVHDPDGIGKFYLGREIAQVMGHEGADWLERPERLAEERPDLLVAALHLRPGDTAADIGAGTGYLSWRLASAVGPAGRVLANDIQPEMLAMLSSNMMARQVTNVQAILGTTTDARLPANSVDLVIMVDVYHEFDQPVEMLQSIIRAVKPGGRIVWVEFRREQPDIGIKRLHTMTAAQVKKEALARSLEWSETSEVLPKQHILIFKKPAPAVKQ